MVEIRALTVRQPYAWAIADLGKDVENRPWTTRYRGLVAVHAASRFYEHFPGFPVRSAERAYRALSAKAQLAQALPADTPRISASGIRQSSSVFQRTAVMPERKTLRSRLRPYLLGAASLFDLSGCVTYTEARRALPSAGDWAAVGSYFGEAGRLLREAMEQAGGNQAAGTRKDGKS